MTKVLGKLKSFNRKPQACALGMDGSLSAVIANTHACGLRLNDFSARQEKLPHPLGRARLRTTKYLNADHVADGALAAAD